MRMYKFNDFLNNWRISNSCSNYSQMVREPYFDIAAKYLPKDIGAIVVDIGAGNGYFADYLHLKEKYKNIYLLDGNKDTIQELRNKKYKKATYYVAPSRLPFKKDEVEFIHCSHFIEHLLPDELYIFLREINRIIKPGGILVISTPMLWGGFMMT